MVEPFHIVESKTLTEDAMRGEPNSIVCQFASNPSGDTADFTGSVLPLNFGLGHDERNVAASSLPA